MKATVIYKYIFLISMILLNHMSKVQSVAVYRIFRELIQNNIAGIPLTHQEFNFEFDPEISVKRRQSYYDLHGFRAGKLIERIGLGIDGTNDQRLIQQEIRDSGRLQGANYREEYALLGRKNYR